MLDEAVRITKAQHLHAGDTAFLEELQDCGAEATLHHVVLEGDQETGLCERENEVGIERLYEAGVHDGEFDPLSGKSCRRIAGRLHHGAYGDDGAIRPLLQELAATDRERLEELVHRNAEAVAARVA